MIIYNKPKEEGNYVSYYEWDDYATAFEKSCVCFSGHSENYTFSAEGYFYCVSQGCGSGPVIVENFYVRRPPNGTYGQNDNMIYCICHDKLLYNPNNLDYCMCIDYCGTYSCLDGYSTCLAYFYVYILGNITCKQIGYACYNPSCDISNRYCYCDCNYTMIMHKTSTINDICIDGTKISDTGKFYYCIYFVEGTSNGNGSLDTCHIPLKAEVLCGEAKFLKCI
jgi:hypothetical protein